MSDYKTILLEIEDGVGIITINRPEVLNALSHQVTSDIFDAAKRLDADDNVGCIVVTGAGEKAFSAGGDIHEQRENDVKLTQAERDKLADIRGEGQYQLSISRKPTIGMMNGLAYGGASVLATLLDMRIGCERTKFRFLAAAYGRINASWTLPNQVGWPIAKELLFTARIVEAEECLRIGLINHLVPSSQLRAKTMEIGRMIAKNHRDSVIGLKKLLNQHMGKDLRGQWDNEKAFTRTELRGAKAEQAFPEFIKRRGRPLAGAKSGGAAAE